MVREDAVPAGLAAALRTHSLGSEAAADLSAPHKNTGSPATMFRFDHVFQARDAAYTVRDAVTAMRLPRALLTPGKRVTVLVSARRDALRAAVGLAVGAGGSGGNAPASLFLEVLAQTMVAALSGAEVSFTVRAVAAAGGTGAPLVDVLLPPARRAASRPPVLQLLAGRASVSGAVGVRVAQTSDCARLCAILASRAEPLLVAEEGVGGAVVALADCERPGGEALGCLAVALQLLPTGDGDGLPPSCAAGTPAGVLVAGGDHRVSIVML